MDESMDGWLLSFVEVEEQCVLFFGVKKTIAESYYILGVALIKYFRMCFNKLTKPNLGTTFKFWPL